MPAQSFTAHATELEGRVIGRMVAGGEGPTVIVFGGIHGNEPAGVLALKRVFQQVERMDISPKGNLIGLAGNLAALKEGKRFLDNDLNRIWSETTINKARAKPPALRTAEEKEMLDLAGQIREIIRIHKPPFYFIDLHTTSSGTLPFMTINDALINRKFAQCFPTPIILGIEEYLEGPLLSYLNEEGYLALGFESGQHQEGAAIDRAEAFIWMVLANSGMLSPQNIPGYKGHYRLLQKAARGDRKFYEITFRLYLNPEDTFEMIGGFKSFQKVNKGTALATYNGDIICLKKNSILFMPLYQKQGEDGYFLIRVIPRWAMVLSEGLRGLHIDGLLVLLPGVRRHPAQHSKLEINLKWVPFISKQFFHLLGYRHRFRGHDRLILTNRERRSRKGDYKNTHWY